MKTRAAVTRGMDADVLYVHLKKAHAQDSGYVERR